MLFTAPCYIAMERSCHRVTSVCLSVRLWRWWMLITYVEPGGILLHGLLAQCLRSPYAKFQRSSAKGTFSNLGLNRGGVRKIGDYQPISRRTVPQKRWEIALRLLLMTNRKSHKPFQMTRKSSTSVDLEGSKRTARRPSCVFWSPLRKFERR